MRSATVSRVDAWVCLKMTSFQAPIRKTLLPRTVRGRQTVGGMDILRAYELMVILDPSLDERTVGSSMEKILNQVTADGGTVDKIDVWGKRTLAYEINDLNEGIYVVAEMHTTPDMASEIDRQLNLNEAVVRTKLLRTDKR